MKHLQFSKTNLKLSEYDLENIQSIIESGWFCEGKYIRQLEEFFRDSCKVKFSLACSNCTSGLIIAFKAAGIKNMRVATQYFTWPSIVLALEYNNNIPVWCDIDKDTWNIKLEKDCDIVVTTDTFGNEVNINTNLPVIVDAAHGFGLPNLGNRGLIEVVSFSFTKPITGGQGGILLTNDESIYEEAKELVRLSAKMTEINAYLILKGINEYKNKYKEKIKIIETYRSLIKIPFKEQKITDASNYSVYAILLESKKVRDKIAKIFKRNNIEVKTYYKPLINDISGSNTEDVYDRIIALPVYMQMKSEVKRICDLINKV